MSATALNSLKIGGRTLVVRPLNLKKLRTLLPAITRFNGNLLQTEQLDDLVDLIIHTTEDETTKAPPERDWLEENVNVFDVPGIFEIVANASGLVPKKTGAGEAPQGEAKNP